MKVTCAKCEKVFTADKIKIVKQSITINKLPFMLTYYNCPLCGCKYHIRIDNMDTLKVQREYDSILNRIRQKTERNKLPTEYLAEKHWVLADKLRTMRLKLNTKYNLSFYQVGDVKERLELNLPVSKTGKDEV